MVEKLHWQLRVLPHVVELFADETLSSPFRLLCSKWNLLHYVCRVLVSVVASMRLKYTHIMCWDQLPPVSFRSL